MGRQALTLTNVIVERPFDLREAPLDVSIACKIRHHGVTGLSPQPHALCAQGPPAGVMRRAMATAVSSSRPPPALLTGHPTTLVPGKHCSDV